jgi:hypothetical protein
MRIQTLPARQGGVWFKSGFKLLAKNPGPVLSLYLLFLIVMAVIPNYIPYIGGFIPFLLAPILFVGLMAALRQADQGITPKPLSLFDGFSTTDKTRLTRLAILGLINLLITLVLLTLTLLIDGGTVMRMVTGALSPNDPALKSGEFGAAILMFVVLSMPVQAALWFAPLFSAWHNVPVGQAMFYSLVAVWRNKYAFLVFIASWFGVAMITSLVLQIAGKILGNPIGSVLMVMGSLLLTCSLYCSIWFTYRDIVLSGQGAELP